MRAGYYDLTVEATGFVKVSSARAPVDAARETSVPADQAATRHHVAQRWKSTRRHRASRPTNAEISQTISMEEINNLPILDRDALSVIQTQPGVVANGNSYTVINGLRTSYSDVTLDGINVQDNYIRDNALDYLPNKLLLGQVRQMTIVSSNGNAAASGGATETAMSTPSGTNQFHGELFCTTATTRFPPTIGSITRPASPLPFLNQNQGGASIGGPIKKDKLFFYSNYEFVRAHQQTPAETTILTANARAGNFHVPRYAPAALHSVEKPADAARPQRESTRSWRASLAQVPGPQFINNNLVGDGLNTGGYRFNQRANEIRDNVTGRLDYDLNTANEFSVFLRLEPRQLATAPIYENDYAASSQESANPTDANFLSASWRWTPSRALDQRIARRL